MRFRRYLPVLAATALHAQTPTVDVERVTAGKWQATYHLAVPVSSLRFERPASFFRERVWTVVTPGYHISRQGDRQVVSVDSSATPVRDIVFEFPEFADNLPKEYEFFQPFTDGAVSIYTGHFFATALGTSKDSTTIRAQRFHTPPGAHSVVHGRVIDGIAEVNDDDEEGTYVYLGTAKPIETPDVVAVIDPGMPQWLRAMFDQQLPALFHEYTRLFGATLRSKPVVLFSYDARGTGRSSGGGSLTGLLNMVFTGAEWQTQSAPAAEQAFHLLAHESAHLWNGQLIHNADDGIGAWMHEGGADAAAAEMLRAFGIIDSARYRAVKEEAINRCAAALATGTVETALNRGAVREVYDCGVVVGMWGELAARKSRPGSSEFSFWHELIERAHGASDRYTRDMYFEALRGEGVNRETIEAMRAFLSGGTAAMLIAGLQQAGLDVHVATGSPPVTYQRDVLRSALVHLMQQACNGRVSLTAGNPIRFGAIPSCAPFANAIEVFRVGGFRTSDQGVQVNDAVRQACATGGAILLQSDTGATLATVPCTKPLAPRTAWYEIGGPL